MKIYFLRGVSGSGKSTEAMRLANNNKDIICSADDCFMKDGEYVFEPSLLAAAHSKCLKKFISLVYNGSNGSDDIAIVDNTNLQWWELKAYWEVAMIALRGDQTDIEIVEFRTPGDVEKATEYAQLCASRNAHNVSIDVIRRQIARMEPLPKHVKTFATVREITF